MDSDYLVVRRPCDRVADKKAYDQAMMESLDDWELLDDGSDEGDAASARRGMGLKTFAEVAAVAA